ncbi:MAG: hypothetical protein AB9866_24950 [Syntrophobacteraceae bacterium]
MNMIFFSSDSLMAGRQLRQVLESRFPEEEMTICRSAEALCRRLSVPLNPSTTAILFAGSRKTLLELVALAPLFRNIWIILILPDREKSTVALAHSLRPRYLTYTDSDFVEPVASVVKKMLQTTKSRENRLLRSEALSAKDF